MQLARFLRPECVRLGLVGGHPDEIDPEKSLERERQRLKREVVEELTDLFMATGQIRNRNKFLLDFVNREKKSSTAIGGGLAIPHVRSMQPRQLVMIFARSRDGVWFDAVDDEPVHLFVGVTGPTYEPELYLQAQQWIARSFRDHDWLPAALLAAEDENEIILTLRNLP